MGADVAARLNLKPIARIVGQATAGLEPKLVMMTPVEAVRKLLKKTGWSIDDVDLVELNEAFAVQAVAVTRELGLDPAKVNVQGGAVALGHPIGASGARILTTLLYALRRLGKKRGIATLCLGGGNGVALAVEDSKHEGREGNQRVALCADAPAQSRPAKPGGPIDGASGSFMPFIPSRPSCMILTF